MIILTYVTVMACYTVVTVGCAQPGLPSPSALFPLNAQFKTADVSSNESPPGIALGVQLADGPDGKPGGSYYLSGSPTSYIEFPGSKTLDTRYSLTLLADVFPERNGPIFNYNANSWRVHWWIEGRNLYWKLLERYTFKPSDPVRSNQIMVGKWSYVGATYDYASGIARIWINGSKAGERNVSKMEIATNYSVRMGAVTHDSGYFQGRVSCLQIYNRALTQNEIEAVKNRCLKINPTLPRTTTGYVAVMGWDLVGSIIYTESRFSSILECVEYCTLYPPCMAVNYNPLAKICELSNVTRDNSPVVKKSGFHYYEAVKFTVYYAQP